MSLRTPLQAVLAAQTDPPSDEPSARAKALVSVTLSLLAAAAAAFLVWAVDAERGVLIRADVGPGRADAPTAARPGALGTVEPARQSPVPLDSSTASPDEGPGPLADAPTDDWQAPLTTLRRTSRFSPKRMHPILHRLMPHQGTDFGAPAGTPVYATFRGEVDWVGPHGGHGNWVSILHPGGIETGYAHLSRFAPGLKHGDKVKTHQLIGYVGSTGRSTGPHLHFSASRGGVFFNAETLLARADRGRSP